MAERKIRSPKLEVRNKAQTRKFEFRKLFRISDFELRVSAHNLRMPALVRRKMQGRSEKNCHAAKPPARPSQTIASVSERCRSTRRAARCSEPLGAPRP